MLAQYQRWFRYILVDEYQDTNVAQYLWLRLLAAGHRNICVRRRRRPVDLRLARRRGRQHPALREGLSRRRVIRLEQNYRSTPHILAAASGLIAANEHRLGKTLWTDIPEGEKVRLIGHWDGEEEARWIGEEIEALARGTRGLDARPPRRHRHPGPRPLPDARLRGPLPHHRPALPRHRRPALLRAPGDPRRDGLLPRRGLARRRPRLRAHRQRAEARHRRQGAAGDQPHRPRATASRCSTPPACSSTNGGLPPRARAALGQLVDDFDRWHAAVREGRDHLELAETHPRRVRLHRHVARREVARRRRPPRQPQGAGQGARTSSRTCRASSSTSAW